ncbi:MAG: TonB-dependent receptor [Pseudomonadota bacterium]
MGIKNRARWCARAVGVATVLAFAGSGPLYAQIEEVVVTAQKRAESVQDVPIAVSAFDASALDAKQIDTFGDLQFNVPNVSYAKGNFSGNNFAIRGLGTIAVGTSADSGVGVHVNDVYILSPRLFETEYYDIEQLEVLRGPQGTLFGRNATGGAINMKTARPVIGEFSGNAEAQLGNFDNRRVKGALNIPINDQFAARIAGVWLEREGYTDNIFTGNDIDDRSQYSLRGSLRFQPNEGTTLDLIAYTFREDSSRTRSQKQFCDFDPSGVLGCLPTTLETDALNPFSTLGYLLPSTIISGPLGLFDPIANPPVNAGNPSDLREVSAFFDPDYEAEEDFVMLEWKQDLGDTFQMTLIAAYQDTFVNSEQDYNGTTNPAPTLAPAAFAGVFPGAASFYGVTPGSGIPVSTVPNVESSLGLATGDFVLTENFGAQDTSFQESEQTSLEVRFNSSFNGPFNFMVAGSYFQYETSTDYFVRSAGLDYFSLIGAGPTATPDETFTVLAPGFFNNETPVYELDSWGIFGEGYYEFSDTLKLTVGLRYNVDEKFVQDRQVLLNLPVTVDAETGATSFLGTPVSNFNELMAAGAAAGLYDADPNTPGAQVFREQGVDFREWTGRIVLDWFPSVGFTDETLVYASYSRGYKGGGINPAIDTTLFPNTPVTFEPEDINAFEIGTKNQLWDNRLQANMSLFYYDYAGLQVSKIVNRTSVNENIDADIWGFEGEFILAPTENWLFNASVAYLNTEVGDFSTVDPRDPTQGRQDVTLVKDLEAANCVLIQNGNGAASTNAGLQGALAGAGIPYIPTGAATGIPTTPGVTDSAFSSCAGLQAVAPAFGYDYLDGIEQDITGNPLPQSPEFQVSLGAEYTHYFGNGATLAGRLDYYWQDEYAARIFDRRQDRIESWDVWNAQVTYTSPNAVWFARGFIQNIADEDNIVGVYSTDQSSGLFSNGFFIEPRLFGLTFGVNLN